MEIDVKTSKLKSVADTEREIQHSLNNIDTRLVSCRRDIKNYLSSSAYGTIDRALGSAHTRLDATSGKIGSMAGKLDTIVTMYESTEKNIVGKKNTAISNETVTGAKGHSSGGGFRGGDIPDYRGILSSEEFADGVDELKKILEFSIGDLESDEMDALTAWLGLLSSGAILQGTDDLSKLFENLLNYSGDYLEFSSDVISAVEKLSEKYGSDELKNWLKSNDGKDVFGAKGLGTASDMVSLVSKVYVACNGSESWHEVCKNFSGSTSTVSNVYIDLLGLAGEQKRNFKNGVATPYAALASIALYALGTEKKDGNYTWQDVADMWLGAGASGANTLLSGATFGLVKLDPDTFVDTVNENVDATTDWIVSNGGPMWWQVTESIAFAPAVAVYSFGETVFDYGWSIGEKITKIL